MGVMAAALLAQAGGGGDLGPFSTGDPLGDLTSYGVGSVIVLAAWRLFKWYRQDQKEDDKSHEAEIAKHKRNERKLLAYVTLLSVEVARLGGDVPPPPTLED